MNEMNLREALEILVENVRFTPKDMMDSMPPEKVEMIRMAKARAIEYINMRNLRR